MEQKRCQCAFKILAQQLVKGIGRTVPVKDFAGPIVEHGLDPLDFAARELVKPRPLGKELAQQPIGILIRSPLPRTELSLV